MARLASAIEWKQGKKITLLNVATKMIEEEELGAIVEGEDWRGEIIQQLQDWRGEIIQKSMDIGEQGSTFDISYKRGSFVGGDFQIRI